MILLDTVPYIVSVLYIFSSGFVGVVQVGYMCMLCLKSEKRKFTKGEVCLSVPNRQPGQNTAEDLSSRDFRDELEQSERDLKDKKDKDRPPPPRSFTGTGWGTNIYGC